MYCPNCGRKINYPETTYCPNCGKDLTSTKAKKAMKGGRKPATINFKKLFAIISLTLLAVALFAFIAAMIFPGNNTINVTDEKEKEEMIQQIINEQN